MRSVHMIGWGVGLSHERKNFAEAETLGTVEGNMCGIATRDAVAPPGSKATSRPKGTRRKTTGALNGSTDAIRFASPGYSPTLACHCPSLCDLAQCEA